MLFLCAKNINITVILSVMCNKAVEKSWAPPYTDIAHHAPLRSLVCSRTHFSSFRLAIMNYDSATQMHFLLI